MRKTKESPTLNPQPMFDRSGKMGRGGGGGAGKRNLHAPPINRTGRPSMGGCPRGRGGVPSLAISSPSTCIEQVEESCSLARENPLNFGMAIKLAPDLVEEIKRVEAQGGGARIKFDVNANNPNGNVIHVGDKVFRFTWSREPGGLCDIYEERQSGEDGNGFLVESGGTWRKLNVERELDESTKNHVKRRSEEAERKHKSRKAIVLDHQNSSMKNQAKAIAASESNSWRNLKNRKEPPFKKAKLDPPSGAPPKPVYVPGLSTTLSKGKISSGSHLSSQPDQHGGPVSPFGSSNLVKGHVDITGVAPMRNNIANSGKEMHSRLPHSTIRDKSKHKRNTEAKPADLKSLMISLPQKHHPVGMNLKALEKATGDIMPNTARQIEPILKQIAVYQTPGKYILKSEVEKDRLNKPPSQSGSSPEVNRHQLPSPQMLPQSPAQDSSFPTRTLPNGEEEQGELNSPPPLQIMPDITEKIDTLQISPPHQQFNDKNIPNNSEGPTVSYSDSGSDSDSDISSSSSDSESHSRSKNRSLVGSSSDSDSDASISSEEASDEEVDIISDDGKKKDVQAVQWSHLDDESVDIGTDRKQDDLVVTDVIEIEKDSPEDFLFADNVETRVEERETGSIKTRNGSEYVVVNDRFTKVQSKRHRDHKRLVNDRSPDRPLQGPKMGLVNAMMDRATGDDNNEAHVSNEPPSAGKRPGKDGSLNRGVKYSERNLQTNEGPWLKKVLNMEAHKEDGLVSERSPVRFSSEGLVNGSKKQKPNVVGDSNGRCIDASLTGSNDGDQNKKEYSSDKSSSLYTKYDKKEPELKGPIKDPSQHEEYVKEYKEKYEIYYSLKRILEAYRDEFSKFGMDLEASAGRDMKKYHDTLKHMRSSFHQCGERHKRLKKIFIVVYKEAKHLKKMIKNYTASNI